MAGTFTCAVGFTVIVKVTDGPEQVTPPFVKVGVTVIVATCGVVPLFTAVNELIHPPAAPLAASPILVLSLVHVQ